jgi:hypothetical protein
MNTRRIAGSVGAALLVSCVGVASARAQGPVPVIVPIIVDTAAPIVVNAVKPKPKPGIAKFEGFIVNATISQITVRAKNNEMAIRTFPLTETAVAKMQQVMDKGGYQYGDKVTVLYDAVSEKAVKVKGKPSRPI